MTFLFRILICCSFACVALDGHAQITESEASAKWLAGKIASDAGGTTAQYMAYSSSLAKTLGFLTATQQAEILGTAPPAGGGGTEGGHADAESAIGDPDMLSSDLLNELLDFVPLGDTDLIAALQRDPPMEGDHLTDLLLAQGELSNGLLVSSLENAKDNLTSENLKELLIANSPVEAVVLEKIASTTKMTAADKAAVIAAQK